MSSTMVRPQNLVEVVPDALVGVDQAGMVRFVNHPTEALFDYDRDDLVGQPIQTLVPEYLWQIYSEHREGYFADPRSRSMGLDLELIGRQRDGTRFPVSISLSVIDTGDVLLVITAAGEIAKRKRAHEDHQRMSSIVEKSSDAIIGTTLNGIVTSWNPAAEKMYGYSSAEIVGEFIHLLNPADRPGEVRSNLAKIKTGQSVDHFQTMRVRKDRSVVPVSLSITPIHDDRGAVVGASVIGRDMTEQKKAYDEAQRMASLVQFSGEALIGGTLEGIITSWNPAAEMMFGYSSEEMIGQSSGLVLPKDPTKEAPHILARIRAGQCVEHLQAICIRKEGTQFPVTLSVAPIRDTDSAIVGLYAIAHDVPSQVN